MLRRFLVILFALVAVVVPTRAYATETSTVHCSRWGATPAVHAAVVAMPAAADSTRTTLPSFGGKALAPLLGAMLIGITLPRTRALDRNGAFVPDDVRGNQSVAIADLFYAIRNHSGSTAPVCAIATVTSKVKTTNNTTFICAGQPIAKAATDNLWTLTGGVLAVSKFRKYRLLLDTAGAATVQASTDAATAALCDFAARPADGTTIVGVLTVSTDGVTTFTPAVTLLGAAGITTAFIDGTDSLELLANQLTL